MNPDPFSTGNSDVSRLGNLRPFKPGVSGNPSGRKKKGAYTKMCEKLANSREGRKLIKETMIALLRKQGMAAVFVIREIGERADGKVMQELDIAGPLATLTDEELAAKYKKVTSSAVISISKAG